MERDRYAGVTGQGSPKQSSTKQFWFPFQYCFGWFQGQFSISREEKIPRIPPKTLEMLNIKWCWPISTWWGNLRVEVEKKKVRARFRNSAIDTVCWWREDDMNGGVRLFLRSWRKFATDAVSAGDEPWQIKRPSAERGDRWCRRCW